MRARTVALVAAAMPGTLAVAAAVLKAGHWQLYADRHRIELLPRPRRRCPHCHGAGGWWVGGANPETEACGCWSDRRELRIRLLPIPSQPYDNPF